MSTDVVDSTGPPPEVPGPFGAPVPASEAEATLRADTLNLFDSTAVAVSSVAPAYSLAATISLLFIAAGVAYAGPAVIIVSFVPVLFIAMSYFYLNRRTPTCGASYSLAVEAGPSHRRLVQRMGPGRHRRPVLRVRPRPGRHQHAPSCSAVGLDLSPAPRTAPGSPPSSAASGWP